MQSVCEFGQQPVHIVLFEIELLAVKWAMCRKTLLCSARCIMFQGVSVWLSSFGSMRIQLYFLAMLYLCLPLSAMLKCVLGCATCTGPGAARVEGRQGG